MACYVNDNCENASDLILYVVLAYFMISHYIVVIKNNTDASNVQYVLVQMRPALI